MVIQILTLGGLLASGGSLGDKTVLAVIKSKSPDGGSTFHYNNTADLRLYNTTNALGLFSISASTGPMTAFTNNGLTVLDESKDDYIVKALGKSAMSVTGDYGIYVDAIYPHERQS